MDGFQCLNHVRNRATTHRINNPITDIASVDGSSTLTTDGAPNGANPPMKDGIVIGDD
jgi:hypothetical protein